MPLLNALIFQFYNSAIKASEVNSCKNVNEYFNSTIVRLKLHSPIGHILPKKIFQFYNSAIKALFLLNRRKLTITISILQ